MRPAHCAVVSASYRGLWESHACQAVKWLVSVVLGGWDTSEEARAACCLHMSAQKFASPGDVGDRWWKEVCRTGLHSLQSASHLGLRQGQTLQWSASRMLTGGEQTCPDFLPDLIEGWHREGWLRLQC